MPDLAVEQIGDGAGGQPDMRVRAHVERLVGAQDRRPHAGEEDERADQPPFGGRQRAADRKAVAEVASARHDDEIERIAGLGIAEYGIVGGIASS